MKNTIYILTFTLLMLSCNTDDNSQQNAEPTIGGQWNLVNVTGGLAGVDDDFEVGLIIWDFNEDNLELTVTNNNTANVIYDGLSSGTYDYEVLSTTGETAYLVIHNFGINHEIITLNASQLVLDEGVVADGFLLTFNR
ncbi:hypothetical protein [Winogradskyella sp. Asnod2-B02-A]|uniref:hypothetical protein n=1 Tax=Winogradskyella sp. Asnod2-B02-A TaxID=3160583 RepID=UPI0038706EE6